MKKIWVIIGMIGLLGVFKGCGCISEYEVVRYKAPNWASDNKIVFVKDYNYVKDQRTITGTLGNIKGSWEALILCEIDNNGSNYKEIETLAVGRDYAYSLGITNTSSAGEWVAIAMKTADSDHNEIFVIKRDGTGLNKIGSGTYPDFSPDANKIVYQKPDSGIWVMNRDGSGEYQIVKNIEANRPAWSPDGGKIGYIRSDSLGIWVVDTSGNLIYSWKGDSVVKPGGPGGIDWGPPDSNAIIAECGRISPEYEDGFIVLYLDSLQKYVFIPLKAYVYRWSPDGRHFKAQDSEGNFIATFGSNYSVNFATKWYLKPSE